MSELCTDNRFELIAKYKAKLIEATNIETAQDEMAVIDNILFRFWQMRWLDKLDADAVPAWIPVTERLPEDGAAVNITWVNHSPSIYYQHLKDKPQTATGVYYRRKWYWWSTVVQDYLAEYGEWGFDEMDDAIEVTHWMPLPEPPKEER